MPFCPSLDRPKILFKFINVHLVSGQSIAITLKPPIVSGLHWYFNTLGLLGWRVFSKYLIIISSGDISRLTISSFIALKASRCCWQADLNSCHCCVSSKCESIFPITSYSAQFPMIGKLVNPKQRWQVTQGGFIVFLSSIILRAITSSREIMPWLFSTLRNWRNFVYKYMGRRKDGEPRETPQNFFLFLCLAHTAGLRSLSGSNIRNHFETILEGLWKRLRICIKQKSIDMSEKHLAMWLPDSNEG